MSSTFPWAKGKSFGNLLKNQRFFNATRKRKIRLSPKKNNNKRLK
jgi:hypothetical protein